MKRIFIYVQRKDRMKLLIFNPHFWLKTLRGIKNDKNDKNEIQLHKYEKKQQIQHKIKQNLKGESKTSRRLTGSK